MTIRINRLHFPVLTLGYGRRIGIWVQGCTIGCAGCCARDTWSAAAGRAMSLDDVVAWCGTAVAGEACDGVTISGGEPFEQPEALSALVDGLRAWRGTQGRPIDILCFSGLPLKRLRREHGAILERLDALVPEPFAAGRGPPLPWRGSANQPLVALSELGRSRYGRAARTEEPPARRLQLLVADGRVECIGIPGHGDLERLEAAAAAKGIVLTEVSWRA